ncbi:MAG: hypothetical protein IPK60_00145 [Sandaracinaceae bacterium]|nr:hypothetical protein [Sandaracinaceae bacterium]
MNQRALLCLVLSLAACGGGDGGVLPVLDQDAGFDSGPVPEDAGPPDPSGFMVQTVDAELEIASLLDLAIDANDIEHIACRRQNSGAVLYVRPVSGLYVVEEVEGVSGAGLDVSLALDNAVSPHIAYWDGDTHTLRYAHKSGSAWSLATIDTLRSSDSAEISLEVVPASGHAAVAYSDAMNHEVLFAENDGSLDWTLSVIDDARSNTPSVGLQLSADADPFVMHGVRGLGIDAAFLAQRNVETWQDIASIPDNGGASMSFAMNGAGDVFVAYAIASGSDDALRLATLRHGETSWSTLVVDDETFVGTAISLAIAPSGEIGIAYYDWQQSDLYYAHGSPTSMDHVRIESARHQVFRSSLAFDSFSRPHIAYRDAFTNHLRIAVGRAPAPAQ